MTNTLMERKESGKPMKATLIHFDGRSLYCFRTPLFSCLTMSYIVLHCFTNFQICLRCDYFDFATWTKTDRAALMSFSTTGMAGA